jgi:hypothetical protein
MATRHLIDTDTAGDDRFAILRGHSSIYPQRPIGRWPEREANARIVRVVGRAGLDMPVAVLP